MRVLVVANLWPSPEKPEIGSFVQDQVDELIRLGAEVDVVSATPTSTPGSRLRYFRLAGAALRRARRSRYDIVACHIAFPTGLVGLLVRRYARPRLVLHAHGSDVMTLPYRSSVHLRVARAMYQAADRVVANSTFTRDALVERLGVPPERVAVVSPGVASAFYGRTDVAERRGVLYVGRLTREKGVAIMIRAMAVVRRSSDVRLTIVGSGPARDELAALADELAVPVDWRGSLPRAAVARVMQEAAVVAVPSTMSEGLGLTVLEGLAAGAVVVSTTSGALADSIVDGRTGFCAKPGDHASLAEAISRALAVYETPSVLASMGEEGAAVAARHDAGRAAERLLQVYEEVLA